MLQRPSTRSSDPRPLRRVRPLLLELEARLPLGDTALSLLATASLLGTHQGMDRTISQATLIRAGEPGASTPGGNTVESLRLSTHPPVYALGNELPPPLTPPAWTALTPPFAPSSPRQHTTAFPSPQRERGVDLPSFAVRAGENAAPFRTAASASAFAAPAARSDDALFAALVGLQFFAAPAAAPVTPTQESAARANFGKLPLSFEQNVGQTEASVDFLTRGPGYALYLSAAGATMVLSQPQPAEAGAPRASDRLDAGRAGPTTGTSSVARNKEKPAVLRMQVLGGNAAATVSGVDRLPGKVNYFLGNDPAKWHTNVSTFTKVEYDAVYPGIDLVPDRQADSAEPRRWSV